jgi:hypothetical protein
MTYAAEKRTVSRTGKANLGWHLGHGYVMRDTTVSKEIWCVTHDNKVLAECRSKLIAQQIAAQLNKE